MRHLFVLLMVGVGMLLPVQAAMNAEFRRQAGHGLWAGLLNFVVGLLALLVVIGLMRPTSPAVGKLAQVPFWAFAGGLIGALLVVTASITALRLGAAALVTALLCGQLLCSLLLDQFGGFGYPVRELDLSRAAGVGCLLAGLWLIQRGG